MLESFLSHFNFSTTELALHLLVLTLNIVLLLFSKSIFSIFSKDKPESFGLSLFRFINISFLTLHLSDLLLLYFNLHFEHFFLRFGTTLLTIYFGIFSFGLLSFLTRKKFGNVRDLDDKQYYTDTYNSRLIDIVGLIIIIIITIYTIINIWGWTSLLETTGIFGLLAAFLALTNQIWAPDLYYGLVILNSKMIEDGDVITMQGIEDEYIINKVTFIYTILLDIRNNHRSLIRNAQLIESKVDNLSKRASTDGLRIKLAYKIGYPKSALTAVAYHENIQAMFEHVQELCLEDTRIHLNDNIPFELLLHETGDYALEYHLFFYLEQLPKTKVTKSIRSTLIKTPKLVNEHVLMASYSYGIELSTPLIVQKSS